MPPMTPHGGDAADFASTWQEICARIQALEALDAGWVVHEAQAHKYSFHPCLTRAELEAREQQLEVRFPPELVHVYTQIGDGGVGPDWGLNRAQRFCVEHAAGNADDYVPGLAGSALLYLAHRYYDWPMYLICSGPCTGSVVSEYDGEYARLGDSIAAVYRGWLHREHLRFGACQRLIAESDDIEEIWRRRGEVLTTEMEDEQAPGMYAEQEWLPLYIYSLCAEDSPEGVQVRLFHTEEYVKDPDVKRAFAAMIHAHRKRVRAPQAR